MNIQPMGIMPSVYNPNRISRNSLNRINPLDNNTDRSHTDFSDLLDESIDDVQAINPLGRYQTKNFADVITSQLAMANAKRTMFGI